MKRKAPSSQEASVKRRKQGVEDDEASNDETPEVRSMQAELSALHTRELADKSLVAVGAHNLPLDLPHRTFDLPHKTFDKPGAKLKLGGPKKATGSKPGSVIKSSNSAGFGNSTISSIGSNSISGNIAAPAPPGTHDGSALPIAKKSSIQPPPRLPSSFANNSISQKDKAAARRSSFSRRGKRVSGSFESGEAVMPHESVPSDKLYKHIDEDLPEPHRARHLLVWCARRAAVQATHELKESAKGDRKRKSTKGPTELSTEDTALLATIQDRIVKQLMDLRIEIPLYEADGLGSSKGKEDELEDDPANVLNRKRKEQLSTAEQRARDEEQMWIKVVQEYNALQSTVLSSLPSNEPSTPGKSGRKRILDVRVSELDEKWQKADEELEMFRLEHEKGKIRELDAELAKRCRQLPFKLDTLRQSLARSNAFTEQAKEFIDDLFTSIDTNASKPNSSAWVKPTFGKSDSGDLFRVLAKTTATASDATMLNGSGEKQGSSLENRRLTAVVQPSTPRRIPGTPRR
ncbi:hypothetical protein FRC14_002485 [Serendipita sp. 396]|nr:hypothetical protein FRC14_002485 [Serendipita sp. 396]KAG8782847.1 hypothetical protein FRC15_006176 [Serendipita sp. 397]KAG8800453.1 hypothetical protein FRC16_002847 [Serendipita sp. 398]KAG8866999.1 hypothetical protein FRC20_006997 [Serendipita sp. 405]